MKMSPRNSRNAAESAPDALRTAAIAAALAALSLTALGGCGEEAGRSELVKLLPDPAAVAGIEAMGEVLEYENDTLYDFLNGGAELYFDYGIVSVASAEYLAGGEAAIEASVYDMKDRAGAFGIYSNIRYAGAEFVTVGNEGMLTASSLDFYKGRYYCRLVTFDMEPGSRVAMLALGMALAANITESGSLPGIIGLLPEDGRIAKSEKYFMKPIALNNVHYVGGENVLRLGEGTEGAAAQYEKDGESFTLFVIRYASQADAAQAAESYMEFLDDDRTVRAEATGRYVVGVWDAGGAALEDKTLKEIKENLERGP